ncbi:MAG: TonB-dependent receptor [Wenzhouxiangellaceae bacterium]|nr:TonB-dependent receptor [Wenzhouxiangellaceae bacterium]
MEQRVRGADAAAPFTNNTRFDNVGEARIEGVEAGLDWRFGDWRANLYGVHLSGDDREQDIPLESIPGDEIGLRLERHVGPALLGGQLVHTAEQDRLLGGPHRRQSTPSHTVIDLFMAWQVTRDVRLNVRVENLADQTYRRHLTLGNQPGRSIKLQLGYQF